MHSFTFSEAVQGTGLESKLGAAFWPPGLVFDTPAWGSAFLMDIISSAILGVQLLVCSVHHFHFPSTDITVCLLLANHPPLCVP